MLVADLIPAALLDAVLCFSVAHLSPHSSRNNPLQDEDVLHGDLPIDLLQFWRKARTRKAVTSVLLITCLAVQGVGTGWLYTTSNAHKLREILLLVFTLGISVISAKSITTRDIGLHAREVVHLTALTFLAAFYRCLAGLMDAFRSSHNILPDTVACCTIPFFVLACLTIGSTLRHPPAHFHNIHAPHSQKEPSIRRQVANINGSSAFGFLFFTFCSPVIQVARQKEQLSIEDLPVLAPLNRGFNNFRKFKLPNPFNPTKKLHDGLGTAPRGFNRLLWRILCVNKVGFIWQSVLATITALLYYAPPFFMQKLLAFLEAGNKHGPNYDRREGYIYCLGLFLALVGDTIFTGHLWFICNTVLVSRIKTQLNSTLFAKTLNCKGIASTNQDKDEADDAENKGDNESFSTKNQILNLFGIDVDRIADFASYSFSIIDAPAELIIGTIFLYKILGVAGFAGIACTIFFLPFNHIASQKFAKVQNDLMSARDRRTTLMNEILQSIKIVKFMAYERQFEARVLEARAEELRQLRRNYFLEVAFDFIWGSSPVICIVVSFYVYTVVQGHKLTPSVAFTSLAVFNELKFAINVIPEVLVSWLGCLISLRRIEKYLLQEEILHSVDDDKLVDLTTMGQKFDSSNAHPVAFRNATIGWPSQDSLSTMQSRSRSGFATPKGSATPRRNFMLRDLTIDFDIGKINLICGPIGAGKTLTLLALLGETNILAGQVVCPISPANTVPFDSSTFEISEDDWLTECMAYVPQNPYLFNATIRENITFGQPYLADRYNATIEACSLTSDLQILEDGDLTEVGEKGVNLSGGQKQRISLARAIYSRASLLLLDDVFSAVDAHTAATLLNKCFLGPLVADRTVILVSHFVQLLVPAASKILHLEHGLVAFEGSAEEYRSTDNYRNILSEIEEEAVSPIKTNGVNGIHKVVQMEKQPNSLLDVVTTSMRHNDGATSPAESSDSEGEESDDEEEEMEVRKPPKKLIEEESRATGRVKSDVWMMYIRNFGGIFFAVCFFAMFLGTKALDVAETYFLRIWSNSNDKHAPHDPSPPAHSVEWFLAVYTLIALSNVCVATIRYIILYVGGLRASHNLHQVLLRSVLRAPLRFFDTIALGRLLNRFGKDLESIDAQLPDHVGRSLMFFLGIVTTFATLFSVSWYFILGFFVLSFVYYHFGHQYQRTARELRRCDAIAKSPLYTLFGETVQGAAVIRSFGAQCRFMLTVLKRIDTQATFSYYLWLSNRWLSMRFSLLSAGLVGLVSLLFVIKQDSTTAAVAGFALTFSLNLTNDMLYLVRRITSLELALVSCERIKELIEVQQEAPEFVEPRPPAHWPHAGEITVENLSIRYAPDLPKVLHSVNFHIPPATRVGVVGKTGSGKSTLALSFFRFVEADEGSITIDGIDIKDVGLTDLRSRITIVPQDPMLISGTLRSSIGMGDDYDDHEIYDALRRVHLLPEGPEPEYDEDSSTEHPIFWNLDAEVVANGENFSQGQRQLIALARALLRRSKVICLDEANSSLDHQTDQKITSAIKKEFSDSSLLIIAHRLRTVITLDKILLMEDGHIAEYDTPLNLIKDPNSKFHALCKAAGKSEFKALKRMAKGEEVNAPPKMRKRKSTKDTTTSTGS